jgi:hypothetical protein
LTQEQPEHSSPISFLYLRADIGGLRGDFEFLKREEHLANFLQRQLRPCYEKHDHRLPIKTDVFRRKVIMIFVLSLRSPMKRPQNCGAFRVDCIFQFYIRRDGSSGGRSGFRDITHLSTNVITDVVG